MASIFRKIIHSSLSLDILLREGGSRSIKRGRFRIYFRLVHNHVSIMTYPAKILFQKPMKISAALQAPKRIPLRQIWLHEKQSAEAGLTCPRICFRVLFRRNENAQKRYQRTLGIEWSTRTSANNLLYVQSRISLYLNCTSRSNE